MQASVTGYLVDQAIPAVHSKRRTDYQVIFFAVNVALVVIGYGLFGFIGGASLLPMKLLRIAFLGISTWYLFNATKNINYIFSGKATWIVWTFIAINLYVVPFSTIFSTSLEKFINLIPYFIYLNYFIVYLNRVYDKYYSLVILLKIINFIYGLPILSFLLFGGSFDQEDIYGEVIGGFVSNHYGWSSALFLATSVDILKNSNRVSTMYKIFILGGCILACYVLAISGSRSGYLTFALSFVLFIARNRKTHIFLKLLVTLGAFYFVAQLYMDRDSALNKRIEKTEKQAKEGDARSDTMGLGFEIMADHPDKIFTGFGFYTFREALLELDETGVARNFNTSIHNSYLELFFGSGIIVFIFFLFYFIGRMIKYFVLSHSSTFVFLPPLILIPFFENNFNPGQFMFFPWFALMIYYIHFKEKQIKIDNPTQKDPLLERSVLL